MILVPWGANSLWRCVGERRGKEVEEEGEKKREASSAEGEGARKKTAFHSAPHPNEEKTSWSFDSSWM